MFKQDNLLVDSEVKLQGSSHTSPWFGCTTANIAAQKEVSYCIILILKRKKTH